jgi:deoxycytidylate deaminase
MAVLHRARPGDEVHVMRVTGDGRLAMAKPCADCQRKLLAAGITKVRYTDAAGNWQSLDLRRINVDVPRAQPSRAEGF